jgi:prepilin-type N-terminal cleavage/methylation domain-containing protein
MRKIYNNFGYSLIEIFIAMAVLSIVLLGMAGLISITVNINRNSAEKTVATSLSQARMEEMISMGYSKLSSTDQTITEDYGDMADFRPYKRITDLKVNKPESEMILITVDVYWNSDNRWVRLQSIVSNTDPDWP